MDYFFKTTIRGEKTHDGDQLGSSLWPASDQRASCRGRNLIYDDCGSTEMVRFSMAASRRLVVLRDLKKATSEPGQPVT